MGVFGVILGCFWSDFWVINGVFWGFLRWFMGVFGVILSALG